MFLERLTCFLFGHEVADWGTLYGFCNRCRHSVWSRNGRSVLYRGKYYRFPPKIRSR